MRKTFLPLMAVLALGGAAIFTAQAQPMPGAGRNPGAQTRPDRQATSPEQRGQRLQQRCDEHYARQVGRLAYIQTRLEITPAQQGAFERWKSVKTDIAKREAASCAARMSSFTAGPQRDATARPSPADRMAKQEDRLKQRLADLSQERPALEALYAALTPEQKAALSHGGGRQNGARHGGFQRQRMQHRAPI